MSAVFFDVDSQLDFLYPAGALYVPGAEKIVPAIARLNRFAAERGIPEPCGLLGATLGMWNGAALEERFDLRGSEGAGPDGDVVEPPFVR